PFHVEVSSLKDATQAPLLHLRPRAVMCVYSLRARRRGLRSPLHIACEATFTTRGRCPAYPGDPVPSPSPGHATTAASLRQGETNAETRSSAGLLVAPFRAAAPWGSRGTIRDAR